MQCFGCLRVVQLVVRRAEPGTAAHLVDEVTGEQSTGRGGHQQINVCAQSIFHRHP